MIIKRCLLRLLGVIVIISILMLTFPLTISAAASLSLSPNSGYGNTTVNITITGSGFTANASGFVWFDTDNDGIKDSDEPQTAVNATGDGSIPSGVTLTTPVLLPAKTYRVRADIPSGGSVEAYAFFTTPSATIAVKITKLANDGTTVLSQTVKTYQWLSSNLPVLGDGTTHYYLQGPVFVDDPDPDTQAMLRWNQDEDTNVQDKDMGALKGTNLTSLCGLVGGMSSGETLKVKSSDGWNMTFAYENVYQYSSREGPMVLTWYKNGQCPDSGYGEGMRLVWFADNSTNPWGIHVFGNWDWHEAADSQYWYYYNGGTLQNPNLYPTTTGLSGTYVSELIINSTLPPPPTAAFTADHTSGTAPLTVHFTDQSTGSPTSWAWDFNNDGTTDSASRNPSFTYTSAGTYTVKLTASNAGGSDDEIKTGYITVSTTTFTITSSAGANGSITPSGNIIVNRGANQTFNISASAGYHILSVTVDGSSAGTVSSYTFTNVQANHTIAASFAVNSSQAPAWDFNNNHLCDIGDVVIVGLHWGETGAHGWISQDLNTNGLIDIGDVVIVGLHWGETW
jgi:PKD repeat protein